MNSSKIPPRTVEFFTKFSLLLIMFPLSFIEDYNKTAVSLRQHRVRNLRTVFQNTLENPIKLLIPKKDPPGKFFYRIPDGSLINLKLQINEMIYKMYTLHPAVYMSSFLKLFLFKNSSASIRISDAPTTDAQRAMLVSSPVFALDFSWL